MPRASAAQRVQRCNVERATDNAPETNKRTVLVVAVVGAARGLRRDAGSEEDTDEMDRALTQAAGSCVSCI